MAEARRVKVVATIDGRLKELGPFDYSNRVDMVLQAVKLGRTSAQKGVPAPDAKLEWL